MIKEINVGDPKKAIKQIELFKEKNFVPTSIVFKNVKLKQLNRILNKKLFYKNDLWVSSNTLYESMKETGGKGSHNFHGLSSHEIFNSLASLQFSNCLFKSKNDKFVILSGVIASCGDPIICVLQLNADLPFNLGANVNKLIAIYPKRNFESYIKSKKVNKI